MMLKPKFDIDEVIEGLGRTVDMEESEIPTGRYGNIEMMLSRPSLIDGEMVDDIPVSIPVDYVFRERMFFWDIELGPAYVEEDIVEGEEIHFYRGYIFDLSNEEMLEAQDLFIEQNK